MGRKRKKNKIKLSQILLILGIILFLCVVPYLQENEILEKIEQEYSKLVETSNTVEENTILPVEGELAMHVIDVGQADSILFMQKDWVMLVDCGTKSKGEDVVQYLQGLGIKKIDILVGTHPHDDHMGGMAKIIQNFEIGVLYTPDTSKENITTLWYMDFLEQVEEKNIEWKYPKTGDNISFGSASIQVLSPSTNKYSNLNNSSIVLRISFGEIDFLLTGDAEKEVEEEIIEAGFEIESEILKAAHHGSDTSNTETFLEKVNPQYIAISVGKDNSYGHPSKSVIERIEKLGITTYRTDNNGTIIFTTDGSNINVTTSHNSN